MAGGTAPRVPEKWGVRPRFGGEPGSALTGLGKTEPTGPARRFGFGIGSVGSSAEPLTTKSSLRFFRLEESHPNSNLDS